MTLTKALEKMVRDDLLTDGTRAWPVWVVAECITESQGSLPCFVDSDDGGRVRVWPILKGGTCPPLPAFVGTDSPNVPAPEVAEAYTAMFGGTPEDFAAAVNGPENLRGLGQSRVPQHIAVSWSYVFDLGADGRWRYRPSDYDPSFEPWCDDEGYATRDDAETAAACEMSGPNAEPAQA